MFDINAMTAWVRGKTENGPFGSGSWNHTNVEGYHVREDAFGYVFISLDVDGTWAGKVRWTTASDLNVKTAHLTSPQAIYDLLINQGVLAETERLAQGCQDAIAESENLARHSALSGNIDEIRFNPTFWSNPKPGTLRFCVEAGRPTFDFTFDGQTWTDAQGDTDTNLNALTNRNAALKAECDYFIEKDFPSLNS